MSSRHPCARLAFVLFILTAASAAPPAASATSADEDRLVIVMRHGVRAPSKSPEALAQFAAQPWPAWPVAPGELTSHGVAALRLLGAWFRKTYAGQGTWPANSCPEADQVVLYADGKDERTVQSGQAVLQGAFPGCNLPTRHGPEGRLDPLFATGEAKTCQIDFNAARNAMLSGLPGGLAEPTQEYRNDLDTLSGILNGGSKPDCAAQPERCFETEANTLSPSGKGFRLSGALATASVLTEALNLEYMEGMSGAALGWGRLNEASLAGVMQLHNEFSDMTRRDPYLAGHYGAVLAYTVLRALSGQAILPSENGKAPRATILLGHDINVANLAGILGLSWHLPGQPDDTPPGGALVLQLSAPAQGKDPLVSISIVAQTADEVRNLQPLDKASPPDLIALKIPDCPDAGCTLAQFGKLIASKVPAECRP